MQKINFFESGNGYPLVFIHGFCESNKIWQNLSKELSEHYRIICPDLPGFGESDSPPPGFSLELIADLLVDWLKSLEITECIVIGHSLGGYISLEILRKHQEFARAIGLFNSSAFEDSEDKKENRNKLVQFINKNGVGPFLKTFVPSLFYPPTSMQYQHIIDEIEKDGLSIKSESVIGYAGAMRDRRDSADLLKQYSEKIMLIGGENDHNVPLEKTKAMAAYLPADHTFIIPESAHMSLFEQNDLCYDAIRQFVDKCIN